MRVQVHTCTVLLTLTCDLQCVATFIYKILFIVSLNLIITQSPLHAGLHHTNLVISVC